MALQPSTTDRFALDYHNFKLRKMRAINASFELSRKHKDIGYAVLTDAGQNTVRPVNIDKPTYHYRFSLAFGKEVTNKNDYLGLQLEGRKSLGYHYADGAENRLRRWSVKFRPGISFKEPGWFRTCFRKPAPLPR